MCVSDGLILKKTGLFLCSPKLNFVHPITAVEQPSGYTSCVRFRGSLNHCEYEQHRWDYRGTAGPLARHRPGPSSIL